MKSILIISMLFVAFFGGNWTNEFMSGYCGNDTSTPACVNWRETLPQSPSEEAQKQAEEAVKKALEDNQSR
jgi:hypothetical protein